MPTSREDCLALDRHDPLAAYRERFALPDGVIYLDGNSLGALPRATLGRVQAVLEREWGQGLIRSWNAAGWIDAPRRIGARIAGLIGARDDEVICADSTSINLFKALAFALRLQRRRGRAEGQARRVILSERGNFPTDQYVAQGLADLLGDETTLQSVATEDLRAHLDATTAVLLLTHVNYRSGSMHDLAALTRHAHRVGALAVWDLSHSVGAVPVDLNGAGVDFAVGCGYKYLNGGPGAPAFVFAAQRHLEALAAERFAQPLSGWFGHAAPFAFEPDYAPAATIDRFAVGTQSILALAALDCGVQTVLEAGIVALREKSERLTALFIKQVEQRCGGFGLQLVSPPRAALRGSQVAFAHPQAWPIMQALIARGVIGDYREAHDEPAPILRFGFAPLYLRYVDAWDAAEALRDVLATCAWDRDKFHQRKAVT